MTHANRLAPILDLKDESGTKFVQTWTDEDEWNDYTRVGDDVVHINLAKRNRVLLVAPLDANTLARLALGYAEFAYVHCSRAELVEFLSDPCTRNEHANVESKHHKNSPGHLKERGAAIVSPQVKTRSYGDHGKGAMAIHCYLYVSYWKLYREGARGSGCVVYSICVFNILYSNNVIYYFF